MATLTCFLPLSLCFFACTTCFLASTPFGLRGRRGDGFSCGCVLISSVNEVNKAARTPAVSGE